MLELMCLMQFLPGGHNVLIGDASVPFGTRREPAQHLYDNQQKIKMERAELALQLRFQEENPSTQLVQAESASRFKRKNK